MNNTTSFCLSIAVLTVFGAPPVRADLGYYVSHAFTLSPGGGVTSAPVYLYDASVASAPGHSPSHQTGSVTFGPGGGSSSAQAISDCPLCKAIAESSVVLEPLTDAGDVSGAIVSNGSVVPQSGGPCCAISSSAIILKGGTLATSGLVNWSTQENHYVNECNLGANICATSTFDPIAFEVTNLSTGKVTTGYLFRSSSHLYGGGEWSWGADMFTLNASNFDFSISMNSPFTAQKGTADLQVRNGLITKSTGTGMFSGIFPVVGNAGNFAVPLKSNFSLDYNLGTFNHDPTSVRFTLDDGGSVCVPEPSSLILLTVMVGVFAPKRFRSILRKRMRPLCADPPKAR